MPKMTSGDAMPRADTSIATLDIEQTATRRRFALRHWHPDVGHVDAATFWLIWRDGMVHALRNSAALSPALQTAAEYILLLAQAQDAAPPVCPHCGARLDEDED
jgi:hypothetical protein